MFRDSLNTANRFKELSIVESGCSVFGEIKKGANLTLKEDVQRLLEHSKQVEGTKYSLHRCSVFGEIKKGKIGH